MRILSNRHHLKPPIFGVGPALFKLGRRQARLPGSSENVKPCGASMDRRLSAYSTNRIEPAIICRLKTSGYRWPL